MGCRSFTHLKKFYCVFYLIIYLLTFVLKKHFIPKILFYVGCEINQGLSVHVEQRLTISEAVVGLVMIVVNYIHFSHHFRHSKRNISKFKRKVANGI